MTLGVFGNYSRESSLYGVGLLNHSQCPGPDGVDHGDVARDGLQDGHHRRHLFQTMAVGCFFHALQLLIERQLLVAMEILESPPELQREGEALEELGYLLHRGHGRVTVSYTHLRAHETPEHLVCRLL